MARAWPNNRPEKYAADHWQTVSGWWNDRNIGRWMREFWPLRFPHVPVFTAFGFCSNGRPNEDTSNSENHAAMGEITQWGITCGPWNMVKPNNDTSVENSWYNLHDDRRVTAPLGRSACMEPNCWMLENGGQPDASAIGVVTLENHLNGVNSRLPQDLKFEGDSSWDATGFCWGWSAGGSRAVRQLTNTCTVERTRDGYEVTDIWKRRVGVYGTEAEALAVVAMLRDDWCSRLARVPAIERNAWIGRAYALAAYDGARGGVRYDNPAHTWTRGQQKITFAADLMQSIQGNGGELVRGYRSPGERDWIENVLAATASGVDPRTVVGPYPETANSNGSRWVAVGLGAALGLAGAWYFTER